jgi:hypothetical protein
MRTDKEVAEECRMYNNIIDATETIRLHRLSIEGSYKEEIGSLEAEIDNLRKQVAMGKKIDIGLLSK